MVRGLMWFRSDLRIDDNPALLEAANYCDELIGVYIFSQKQWNLHHESNVKQDFLIQNLITLEKQLRKLHIPLIVLQTDTFKALPKDLQKFVENHQINSCYWNNEFGVNENKRDDSVETLLSKNNIQISRYHDQVLYEPGFLRTGQGRPFSVFTPFKRRWIENFSMSFLDLDKADKPLKKTSLTSDLSVLKLEKSHQVDMDAWPAGEADAFARLQEFLEHKINNYSESRNTPILDGTSRISAYLALGIISPRRCILEALKLNNFEFASGNQGICKWVDEIVWREFYRNIMHSFPKVSCNLPFQDYTRDIPWRHSSSEIAAFKTGNTGFPIIDAAIKQLLSEGWMHNRLRMIVAMFFTKNMLHDWRIGEQFFMEHLIDADFASNNGGWQWSASTGTDAAPYFRIFNPITQSQNFDPTGEFIKKFIPELSDTLVKNIHQPTQDLFSASDYPKPILDLKESRQRAILAFKETRDAQAL
jgi:deoxyribodipyrimidine photo-lyase